VLSDALPKALRRRRALFGRQQPDGPFYIAVDQLHGAALASQTLRYGSTGRKFTGEGPGVRPLH
jgi:hypothetical protein